MSESDRNRKEAEREARRARRLAERAEARAERKAEQARRAEERAQELSARAGTPRTRKGGTSSSGGDKDSPRSIDDMLDEVTQRADEWIEAQTSRILDTATDEVEKRSRDAERVAQRAAEIAAEAGRKARLARKSLRSGQRRSSSRGRVQADLDLDLDFGNWGNWWGGQRGYESRHERQKRREAERARRRKLRGRKGWAKRSLYRDDKRGHIFGVCAGVADYLYMDTWKIRLAALAGLFFFPGVVIPSYFIAYWVMDPKPYYRRVTDRFQELDDEPVESDAMTTRRNKPNRTESGRPGRPARGAEAPRIPASQALRTAKAKFSDIEERLRSMESHVTSSTFELKRELRKISGDD